MGERRHHWIACFALAALMLVVGCGNEGASSEVGSKLKLVNDHLRSAAGLLEESARLREELNDLYSDGLSDEDCLEATGLLEKIQENTRKALDEVGEAEAGLVAVQGMDMGEEMETYVEMKLSAIVEQARSLELELEVMLLVKKILAARKTKAPEEEIIEYEKQMSELQEQVKESAANAQNLHREANDYYEETVVE